MSHELTGNRHMGATMKKKQAYLNEWKVKARRKIMPGYPIEKPFETREQVDAYLNCDKLVCLLCGKSYKSLCGHLSVHGTNADDYKEKYGLPFGAGLTCLTTKAMNVKHGKRLVKEGIFKPLTKEEHKEFMKKKRPSRKKPSYAIYEGTLRISGKQPEKIFKENHYWKILELAEKEQTHPTDICKKNKDVLPSTSMFHIFKKNNKQFKDKYDEIINNLPLKIQLSHGIAPKEYVEKIKNLRMQGKTNAQVAEYFGVHEVTIEKYNKKFALKKPLPNTCKNGLHPYPGIRNVCQPCNTINKRKRTGTMDRQISKTIIINRKCSLCNEKIQVSRLVGEKRTTYCDLCKKKKYYESQKKYAKEKRHLLKEKDK